MFTALILSLALVCAQDPTGTAQVQPAELPVVLAGSGGFGFLASPEGVRLNLQIDEPGEVTISLESIYFDAALSVIDGQGRVLGSDGDSGAGDNAWLTLEVKPFVTYEILVGCENEGGRGAFFLAVHEGRSDPPAETRAESDVRTHTLFAEHEVEKGKLNKACELYFTAGNAAYMQAEHQLAMPPLREAIALGKETGIAAYEIASMALLGACERRVGDVETAVELLEGAWERRADAPNAQVDCLILENLGEYHADRREYEEALKHFTRWSEIAAEVGLANFEALAHARRARMQERMFDRTAAGESHDRALALLDSFDDPYIEAQILLAAGQFLNQGSRYDDAANVLRRAADIVVETGPAITWEVDLLVHTELGEVQTWRGRYGAARKCLERASQLLGDRADRRFELQLQMTLCTLAERTGDIYRAREICEFVIEVAREQDNLPVLMVMTRKLGSLQEKLGDFFAAERTYEEALGLAGGLDRPEHEWQVLFAQGRLTRKQERHDKALDLYMLALERAEALEDESAQADCLNGIAYTLTFLPEREGALASARDGALGALAIWDAAGAPDEALIGPLHTLAVIALHEGKLDEVDRLLARADDIIEREDVAGLDRDDAAGVRSGFTEWGEVAQDSVALRLEDADAERLPLIAEGFDRAGRWKARALLEGMPAQPVPRDRIGVLRDELGDDRVLIEYAHGARKLYAYVLDGGGLSRFDLGPAPDLDEQVEGFLAGMTDAGSLAPADEIAKRGGALHDLMLAPILAELDEGIDGLVIVPTPGLARLPFEALVTSANDARGAVRSFDQVEFLADRYHVTYGPSSPVLARLGMLGSRRTPGRALVMGDPWYASEAAGIAMSRDPRTSGLASYDRLLATKAEVVDIAEALLLSDSDQDDETRDHLAELAALKRERSGALESRRFDLYVGEAATADILARDLRQYEVLHIAAHGEVDPEDPLRTGLILSFDGNVHGYVTLLDILDMQLDANLVVLSACETASGRVLKGEGVQSMAQAFLQAGSRAVVASLWSVDDQATRATMSQFYESILLGERRGAEALRDAKNLDELKRNVRLHGNARGEGLHAPSSSNVGHPYYWAPFIYVGAIP
jgi:CHAT domain-containing protein/tetratricopeptide (TPR) repeat protein